MVLFVVTIFCRSLLRIIMTIIISGGGSGCSSFSGSGSGSNSSLQFPRGHGEGGAWGLLSPPPPPTFFLRWCFLLNFFPLASHFRDPYQNVAQPPFQTYSVAPVSIVSQIKFLVS